MGQWAVGCGLPKPEDSAPKTSQVTLLFLSLTLTLSVFFCRMPDIHSWHCYLN